MRRICRMAGSRRDARGQKPRFAGLMQTRCRGVPIARSIAAGRKHLREQQFDVDLTRISHDGRRQLAVKQKPIRGLGSDRFRSRLLGLHLARAAQEENRGHSSRGETPPTPSVPIACSRDHDRQLPTRETPPGDKSTMRRSAVTRPGQVRQRVPKRTCCRDRQTPRTPQTRCVPFPKSAWCRPCQFPLWPCSC